MFLTVKFERRDEKRQKTEELEEENGREKK